MTVDTQVYTTPEGVVSLASHWDNLQTFLDAPVAKFDWIVSCVENLLSDSSLYIPIASEGETPVAIAPLAKPDRLFSAIRQIGVDRHGEPEDFVYQDLESLEKLSNALARAKVPLLLMRIPEESPVVNALKKSYKGKALVNCRSQVSCPFIDINAGEEKAPDNLSSRLRSDLRRARRKAETFGEVSFEIHSPTSQEELTPLWKESLRIEAAGWKGRGQTALAADQSMSSFFLSYLDRACKKGILRICFMKINDQAVATQIAIESSNRFWLLKIGYDETFANCSPGMLLMLETLKHAARNDLRSYEFLGASNEWTRRWTKNERNNITVRVYPYTVKGIAILVHDIGYFLWRRMIIRLKKGE